MINTKKICAVVGLSLASALSFAEGKIAVINPEGAILSTSYAKAKFDKLEKTNDYAATKAKLDGIQGDFKTFDDTAKKEGPTWSAEKQAEAQKKLQNMQQDYQFNAKKLQTARQELAQTIGDEMGQKYQQALKQIVDAEKIGLLLGPQAALFATSEYDITAKVTDLLNKTSDQATPAAAPAKAK